MSIVVPILGETVFLEDPSSPRNGTTVETVGKPTNQSQSTYPQASKDICGIAADFQVN